MNREEDLKVIKNMSDKDKMEFYKKEMEIQIKIVFSVSKERNSLVKGLRGLIEDDPYLYHEDVEQLITKYTSL